MTENLERPYISPHVVNAYLSYMRRGNPGRGMTLEEFAREWDAKPNQSKVQEGE